MNASLRRHALSTVVGLGAVAALTAAVAVHGFDDFASVFWVREAATVGAVAYVFALLVQRALANPVGAWRRASTFGAAAGALVVVLALAPRLAYLDTAGLRIALVLTSTLGATLGLAAVEGVRWVRAEALSTDGAM